MYGIGKTWADALRQFEGGRMKSTRDDEATKEEFDNKDFPAVNDIRLPFANPPPPRDHYLKNVNRFFRKSYCNSKYTSSVNIHLKPKSIELISR